MFIPGTGINIQTNFPQFHLLWVTPEMARWLLDRSNGNQVRVGGKNGIKSSHLQMLRGIIARGEWKATHQGGAIDWNGVLFDGHHRLTAIAEQTEALPMWFKLGCDPAENMAVDQGAVRSVADTLQMDKKETEVLRLAMGTVFGCNKPTPAQIEELTAQIPLVSKHRLLMTATTTHRQFFTCTPMRLAACAQLLAGGSEKYILQQWRALALSDYDLMSSSAKSLTRQFMDGKLSSSHKYDAIARGLIVFDEERKSVSKIQVNDTVEAISRLRMIVRKYVDSDS